MVTIHQSKTADTRSCDFSKVSREQLLSSSLQHIGDVQKGMQFLVRMMQDAAINHDPDKITGIDQFHAYFITGFKQTGWWDNHRKVTRHHLLAADGVPADVNLIDVLEMIVDCVMAGMARSGSVYPLNLSSEVLMKAFQNTVILLKSNIQVDK